MADNKRRVVIAVPVAQGPWNGRPCPEHDAFTTETAKVCEANGWTCDYVEEQGNPYISVGRANMLRKAVDAKADAILFCDYDVTAQPDAVLRLLAAEGDVVAGTYRYKDPDKDHYMGSFIPKDETKAPIIRKDGCIKAKFVPAGFLRLTMDAVRRFMIAYPELVYHDPLFPKIDLFQHGAHERIWYGEDYAFCRRWIDAGGEIWCMPNLDIDHHGFVTEIVTPEEGDAYERKHPAVWKGNFWKWMERQAKGDTTPRPPVRKDGLPELCAAEDMAA